MISNTVGIKVDRNLEVLYKNKNPSRIIIWELGPRTMFRALL